MLRALLYLRFVSAANWMRVRGRRLRQPKYFVGAAVGCAYFYFFFFRPLGPPAHRPGGRAAAESAREAAELAQVALPTDWLPAVAALAALGLFVFMVMIWTVPTQRAALGFTEAEIAFLFPAPVTRRALVHFRLLSAQLRSLIGAAVMMLFSRQWTLGGGNPALHAVGWWFIFSALNLHFSGAGFTLTRLADLGVSPWRRRAWVLVLAGATVGMTLAQVPALPAGQAIPTADAIGPALDWLIQLTATVPLSIVLTPFKWLLGPFLAAGAREFLLALVPALGVVILHYLWVVRSAVAFDDASLAHAEKRSARLAAWQAGQRPGSLAAKPRAAPFSLPATGRPEVAFLWKNLLAAWEYFTPRVFLACGGGIVGLAIWLHLQPTWRGLLPAVAAIALTLAGYTLIVGPQFARQDVRSDLLHADILKTYPLAGWQIILGELLTPIVILTGIVWLALLATALTLHPPGETGWLTLSLRVSGSLALAMLTPAVVTLQLLVPNAAALLFPGWFQTTRTRGGGPEVIGQRMIFFFAQLLTMVVVLFPAVSFGALLVFIGQWLLGPIVAVWVGAAAILVILGTEIGLGVWWLGRRFQQLDVSADLRS